MILRTLVMFSALLVTSCGGGSDDTPPPKKVPSIPTDFIPSLYSGITSQAFLENDPTRLFISIITGNIIDDSVGAVFSSGNSDVVDDRLVGRCGGFATFINELDPINLLGRLFLDFESFDDCSGSIINGGLLLEIIELEQNSDEPANATFTFRNTQFTNSDSSIILAGDVNFEFDQDENSESYTSQLFELSDTTNEYTFRFENYSEKIYYSDSSRTREMELAANGRIFASDYGFIDITTFRDRVCMRADIYNCDTDFSRFASVHLQGELQSSASLKFIDANTIGLGVSDVGVDVDTNGDGEIDFFFSEAYGTPEPAYVAYLGPNAEYLLTEQLSLAEIAQSSVIPQSSDVSFDWTLTGANSSLNNTCYTPHPFNFFFQQSRIIGADTDNPELLFLGMGDFCLRLEINERNTNTNLEPTDNVVIRLLEKQLFVSREFPLTLSMHSDASQWFEYTHLNDDDRKDLLVRQRAGIYFYLQNEQGTFDLGSVADTPDNFPAFSSDTVRVDLNNDHNIDLVYADSNNNIYYTLQTDNRLFDEPVLITGVTVGDEILSGNLNNDAMLDLVFVSDDGFNIVLQNSEGFDAPLFYEAELTDGIFNIALLRDSFVGDSDNNGIDEIIYELDYVITEQRTVESLSIENGSLELETLWSAGQITNNEAMANALTLVDIDLDGDKDFVSFTSDEVRILEKIEGELIYKFIPFTSNLEDNGIAKTVTFADFNNDDNLDMFLDIDGRYSAVLLQNNDNTFQSVVATPLITSNETLDDINGDGIVDVVSVVDQVISIRYGQID